MTKKVSKTFTIKSFNNAEDMMVAYPLVKQMYKDMDLPTYKSYIEEMIKTNNFKMIAAFDGDEIIGACGYWVFLMLYCGRYIQISNLVVDEKSQNLGVGKIMMNHIEELGRKLECKKFVLDSYTENKKSHSLYFREGFYIRGFHFMKDL
jgi:ribosomal protein S18 acetylase RimI-like enzyme